MVFVQLGRGSELERMHEEKERLRRSGPKVEAFSSVRRAGS